MSKALDKITRDAQMGMRNLRGETSKINWQEFNYPCCVKLIHYRLSELNGLVRSTVQKMNWIFLIITLWCMINFLSTCIQVGTYAEGINIFYSILNMIIFIPLSGLCFYVGYRATCGPQRGIGNETLKYRVGQAVCSILWFIFSILRAGCFNGWMRIKPLMDEGSGGSKFCIFLVILEAIMLTIASALGIFCIFMAGKAAEEPIGDTTGPSKSAAQRGAQV